MPGKQAKILSERDIELVLAHVRAHRHAKRDRVIVLLSVRAGLRAGEIAGLTWPMVLNGSGQIGDTIELHDCAAKRRSGRRIPIHPSLGYALRILRKDTLTKLGNLCGHVVLSERGRPMRPSSIVNWFGSLYRELGLEGCSSHSGRRTFVTRAARLVHRAGGSLRDVQELAGHRSINMTQRYIEGDRAAQRRLIYMI